MSDNHDDTCNWDSLLEDFAAELTSAAYPLALRHGTAGMWVDLELDLWKALADTVKKWERGSLPCPEADLACDWAVGQSAAVHDDVRNGPGYWRNAQEPLSGE